MAKSPNFQLTLVVAVAPAAANTEFTVMHGLTSDVGGIVPHAYLVARRNLNALLYLSGTAWTSTTAYFKSDTATAEFWVAFF